MNMIGKAMVSAVALGVFSQAVQALDVVENVLINFGDMDENSFDGVWNHQKGTETGLFEWDRYTTALYDAASLDVSDIEVKFEKISGLSLLSPTHPVRGHDNVIDPTPEMQQMWRAMHKAELTDAVTDTYWIEEITVGVAASIGDITVSNLNANSTYAVSGMFTVGSVASLIGSQAPITLSYKEGAIKEVTSFLTTQTGSVEFVDLYLGNFNLAGLLGGDTFIMTWIFETQSGGTTFDLGFNSSLISLGGHGAMRALAITEYGENNGVAAVAAFMDGVAMLPEPTTGTLSLAALVMLCARRRRRS